MDRPDFMLLHAQSIAKLPEGWRWYQWILVNHGTAFEAHRLTGCVPSRVVSRGPRKGRPDFKTPVPGTMLSIQFSVSDHDAFRQKWEIETGKCKNCCGSGQEWAGWSVSQGTKYRDCLRCAASGNAPFAKATGETE